MVLREALPTAANLPWCTKRTCRIIIYHYSLRSACHSARTAYGSYFTTRTRTQACQRAMLHMPIWYMRVLIFVLRDVGFAGALSLRVSESSANESVQRHCCQLPLTSSICCIKRYKFALIFIELFSKISVMRCYAFMRKYIDERTSFQNKRPIKLAVFPTVRSPQMW